MNTDGGDLIQVTVSPGTDLEPVWSPDSEDLIFASDRVGTKELFQIGANGSDVERLGRAGLPFSWVRP